jgi:membrane-associated phospholipid phosphatase
MKRIGNLGFLLAALAVLLPGAAVADEVTDWNRIMFQAALHATPAPTSPLVMTRNAALVEGAVYDAVNGIQRRYTPLHVQPAAARGASIRAAAVQAAYATLVRLYSSQQSTLDQQRAASLAAIANGAAAANSVSIARGIAWGQFVADAIWTWRSTDGFTPPPPPFLGGSAVGQWRPTPPAFLPGAGPQFAYMTPWVILSPYQFRPLGPPALDNPRYTADFLETKSMGSISSSLRSADQTLAAQFWATSTASYFWDTIAVSLGAERHNTLSENARLLALLNVAMADAAIACWEAKYHYVFWRPVTAIPLADTDGNSDTIADPAWTPLLVTPNHPEYPSGHSTVSGAAAAVLADYFGEATSFSVDSDVMTGVVRSFPNFSAALSEIKDARIFAGIHYRSACDDGQMVGIAAAQYVMSNAFQPINGSKGGQIQR